MRHHILLLLAFWFTLPGLLPAQAQDQKRAVTGVLLSVTRVKEYRQITVDVSSRALHSALTDLLDSHDEYLIVVQVGGETYAGRFVLPMLASASRHIPTKWPLSSPVEVRFKKGGKSKVRMYVRGPNGKEVSTELVSVIAADGHEKCKVREEERNCTNAWNQK